MNTNQFAQLVKAKYPQYAQVDDNTLTQKVVSKYPQYGSMVDQAPQQPPQAQPPMMNPDIQQKAFRAFPDVLQKYVETQVVPQDPYKQKQMQLMDARISALGKDKLQRDESMVDVYQGPDGKYSTIPKPGYKQVGQVPLKEAYQYGMAGQLAGQKAGIAGQKEVGKEWNELQKTVNPFRTAGIGGASSTFNKAAVANQAAARGLKILRKPSLTWQELNAYVNTDIASIQRGGTPTDIQLHEANYSTLLGKIGEIKTYASGKPAKGLIPPETRKQIERNILDIISVDNEIIDDALGYAESAYPNAISAFPDRWQRTKAAAQKIKTVGQSGGGETGGGDSSGWSITKRGS